LKYEIGYGKAEVSFYRTRLPALAGVPAIPESSFTGRDNTLFGAQVSIEVFGENFLASYTEGDNTQVVATDTMKNFVYAAALEYRGSTQEGFARDLARRLLETYPQVERVRISSLELPYRALSEKLLSSERGDRGWVELRAGRSGLEWLEAGRRDLRLVKLTGSAFQSFARDRYTTLPESVDRPLHIHLDVFWRYADPADAGAERPERYVASEQVRDLVQATFDEFVSMSIQHLVHEMGRRLLERFSLLGEVRFAAQNRLWDTSAAREDDPAVKVYSDPKPAHGTITMTIAR
jgi:urate oxidase